MLRLLSSAAAPSAACLLRSSVASASVHAARRALQRGQGLGIAATRGSAAQAPMHQVTRTLHSASSLPRAPRSTLVGSSSVSSLRAVGSSSSPLSLQLPWSARLSTLASPRHKRLAAVSVVSLQSPSRSAASSSRPPPSARASRTRPPPPSRNNAAWRKGWTVLRLSLAACGLLWLWDKYNREQLVCASLQHWDVESIIARGGLPVALPPPIHLSDADRRAVDQALPWHLRFVSGIDAAGWLAELVHRVSGLPAMPTLSDLEGGLSSPPESAKTSWWPPLWLIRDATKINRRVEAAELLLDAPALWPISDAVRMQAAREILEQAIPQALRILAHYQHHDVKLQPSDQSMWRTWAVLTECYTRLGHREELEQAARCMQRAVEREANKRSNDAAFREQLQLAVDEVIHDRRARLAAMDGDWFEFVNQSLLFATAGTQRMQCEVAPSVPDPLPLSIKRALSPSYSLRRQGRTRFGVSLLQQLLHDPASSLPEGAFVDCVRVWNGPELSDPLVVDRLDASLGLWGRLSSRWSPPAPLPIIELFVSDDRVKIKAVISFDQEQLSDSAILTHVKLIGEYATLFRLAGLVLGREGRETRAEQMTLAAQKFATAVNLFVDEYSVVDEQPADSRAVPRLRSCSKDQQSRSESDTP